MGEIRILIADDHDLVRETIAAFLEQSGGFAVHTAVDLASALSKVESDGPYDLILLDFSMAGINGISGLRRTIEANPELPIAVISGTADPSFGYEAVNAGARGFVPKTLSAEALIHAVRLMASGERYLPIGSMTAPAEAPPPNPLLASLTTREIQVLTGLCAGLTNKEIAREHGVEEVTVKVHVKTLCRKLGARNRTHAAMIAKDASIV